MQQKFISVCSGIEAASEAWMPLGWQPQFYSEIEKFPASVLEYRHPGVPNLGDMTKFKEWSDYDADVLVGGTPCQSFSVAGLRKGLDDPRGNLMLTYLAIADRYRHRWVVWENVPGVLSSNKGRDFGTFLGALGQLGYGFAYRVLDAQYFGVPQRRRRVFVVGCLGGWQCSAAVLFEQHSLCGNPSPSGKAGQEVAGTITACSFSGGAGGRPEGAAGNHFLPVDNGKSHWDGGPHPTLSQSLKSSGGIGMSNQEIFSQRGGGLVASYRPAGFGTFTEGVGTLMVKAGGSVGLGGSETLAVIHGTQDPLVSDKAFPLGRNNGQENAIVFAQNSRDEVREMKVVGALAAQPGAKQQSYLRCGMSVRRLTPLECERLQGFPDNYTLMPHYKNRSIKDFWEVVFYLMGLGFGFLESQWLARSPDGHRYKALGNSMAVPVMKWIGERIEAVESVVEQAT